MKPRLTTGSVVTLTALAATMAATRYQHFGSAVQLPDASLAVFLLGGFYLLRARWFALFLAEAALIDQLAFTLGGASGWCFTPAYVFLVPACGAAWLAGAWAARGFEPGLRGAARAAGAFAAGVVVWFVVSNAGFFLFSGYFGATSAAEYAMRVVKYLPPYAAAAAGYVLLAAAVHALWVLGRRTQQRA